MTHKKISSLIKISVLSAMAFILMFLEFPLPMFPDFLKIDISDIPALFAAFSIGPFAGVLVEFIKNLLHLIVKNSTAGIGEFANFIVGFAMVFTAGVIYKKNKTKKGAVFSLICGTVAMAIIASLGNYFIFLPLYEKVLMFPIKAVVGIASKVNKNVKDINTLIIYSILPFNILKGIIVSLITLLVYKKVSPILHK
ncbi:ECF transporter S component [Caloramator sp. E03]|uniref:ECF transporter S component n=1 Tax=Caloramator sp. E03 TaxID=2576307 RepID=UPI0011106DDA|nr:ECF transporter S component [Caloramator sp. E03]QCX33939.1 ECF transporter S component [Caloramator sp. E03]